MNASQRRRYGRKVEKINRALEDVWLPRIKRTIQAKANAVISRLRQGTNEAFQYLSTDLSNPALSINIKKLYSQVGLIHAKRVNDELRAEPRVMKRLGFNATWIAFVNDYLERFLFQKITFQVNETTRDALMRAVQKGISGGLGVDEIIRNLEDWPFARFQAARIVRTEINRAANVGAMAGGSTFKFEQQKEWIAAKDSRTRGNPFNGQEDHANHWTLDGSVVDEKGVFTDSRNGDQLQFPGDPSASAASVINCRCSVAMTAKRDEKGRLVPKRSMISVIPPGQFRRPEIIQLRDFKPDYSEILSNQNNVGKQIKEHLDSFISKVKTEEIIEKVNLFNERLGEVVYDMGSEVRSELDETKNAVALLISKKSLEDAKGVESVITLINSKEYNPEIKTDSFEVIRSVDDMRAQLINLLQALKEELIRKKRWLHTIQRDSKELIKTITSQEI